MVGKNWLVRLKQLFQIRDKTHWEEITATGWRQFTSPWRPSAQEIRAYQDLIAFCQPNRVLVLGATPEIREILASRKLKVTVVDFSLNMVEQMSKFMSPKNQLETWVIQDWRASQFPSESFDLILGDLVFRLVPFHHQEQLLKKIANWLVTGGYLLSRIHYVNQRSGLLKRPKLVKEIFRNYQKRHLTLKQAQDLLVARLLDRLTDWSNHTTSQKEVSSFLKDYLRHQDLTINEKRLIEATLQKWGEEGFVYTQRSPKEIADLFSLRFQQLKKKVVTDYEDASAYPLVLWQKP